MASNKLSYVNRNYNDIRHSIIDFTQQYYSDVFENLNDASIGQWLVDVMSDIYDCLNYHLDRSVQETTLDNASELSSLLNIARTNGLHVPYKKAALVEVELSCVVPLYEQGSEGNGEMLADERYAPTIKNGTQFSNGTTTFELTSNVDFKEQFDENGTSNRQIIPNRNSNGTIVSYTYKKLAIASACQSRVMKHILTSDEIKPFMEIEINDSNVLGIESIIVKEGTNIISDPTFNEFFVDKEEYKDTSDRNVTRFFEVNNLIEQYRFGYQVEETDGVKEDTYDVTYENGDTAYEVKHNKYYNPIWEISEKFDETDEKGNVIGMIPIRVSTKGKWKPLKHKFITEYDDNWNLKVIFGAGIENKYGEIPTDSKEFTQYQMSRMMANDYMGVLPIAGNTMYILYKRGGGEISNIAKDTLTNILFLDMEIEGNCEDGSNSDKLRSVKNSITVTNTTPSYGGKDEPTAEEIKYMIKYNTSCQNRCVTLKDYESKINQIPAKYGSPFRFGIVEENNKIVIYTLGLDYNGNLTNFLSETVAENMKQYLSQYRMINDFVEIKSGKIINLSFRIKVYIDKSYDKTEVTKRIIDMVYDYMDIRRHIMGEDIFIGDLHKELSKLDGVENLVSLRIANKVGEGYSEDATTQQLRDKTDCMHNIDYTQQYEDIDDNEIDLDKSDYTLFSESNSMFEIKYKSRDIKVEVRTRN